MIQRDEAPPEFGGPATSRDSRFLRSDSRPCPSSNLKQPDGRNECGDPPPDRRSRMVNLRLSSTRPRTERGRSRSPDAASDPRRPTSCSDSSRRRWRACFGDPPARPSPGEGRPGHLAPRERGVLPHIHPNVTTGRSPRLRIGPVGGTLARTPSRWVGPTRPRWSRLVDRWSEAGSPAPRIDAKTDGAFRTLPRARPTNHGRIMKVMSILMITKGA